MATTVTTLAKKKMLEARAGIITTLPKITGIAYGNGGVDAEGNVKTHNPNSNSLFNELMRKPVDGHEVVSATCIRYNSVLGPQELAGQYISEVGLYDASGDMVAMKAFLPKGKDADMSVTFECEDTF